MLPGGQLVESCAVMADYWPAKHIYQPDCQVPPVPPTTGPEPSPTLTPCKPDSICHLLTSRYTLADLSHQQGTSICRYDLTGVLFFSIFEECHPFVSPDNFYRGCAFDSCHVSNPAVECTSLQTYAAACAQAGVCLHWRNHTTICGILLSFFTLLVSGQHYQESPFQLLFLNSQQLPFRQSLQAVWPCRTTNL